MNWNFLFNKNSENWIRACRVSSSCPRIWTLNMRWKESCHKKTGVSQAWVGASHEATWYTDKNRGFLQHYRFICFIPEQNIFSCLRRNWWFIIVSVRTLFLVLCHFVSSVFKSESSWRHWIKPYFIPYWIMLWVVHLTCWQRWGLQLQLQLITVMYFQDQDLCLFI